MEHQKLQSFPKNHKGRDNIGSTGVSVPARLEVGGYLEYITTLVPCTAAALKLIAALYVYLAGMSYILHFCV